MYPNKYGGRHLDVSTRRHIVHLFHDLDKAPEDIASVIQSPRRAGSVDVRTIKNVLTFYEVYGHVENIGRRPRPRRMSPAHTSTLIAIVKENPWLYLDEISDILHRRCGVAYHSGNCYVVLIENGYSLKAMRERAAQRDEKQREEYFFEVAALYAQGATAASFVFTDETAKVESVLRRKRGWGARGARVEATKFLFNHKHISILALYGIEGFIDFDWVEGGYKAEEFMDAVEFMIIPKLQQFPLPNSVLVLDNCGIHHTYEAELKMLAASRGAKVLFLAPYSPIDNPIESAFNVFKMYWTRHAETMNRASVSDAIRHCLFNCYASPAASARASYLKCGYI